MYQNSLSGGVGKGPQLGRIVSSGLLLTLGMYRVLGDKAQREEGGFGWYTKWSHWLLDKGSI